MGITLRHAILYDSTRYFIPSVKYLKRLLYLFTQSTPLTVESMFLPMFLVPLHRYTALVFLD